VTAPSRLAIWLSASFLAALVTAVAVLALAGTGDKGTIDALRVTARLSFFLFWPAYAGGFFRYLQIPFVTRLGRMRREFGLSFVAAHSVHVALILWLFYISAHAPVPLKTVIIDGIGIAWMYVLAALSFDVMRRKLRPEVWRIVFNLGLEYITFVFLTDFLIAPLKNGTALSIVYWPFTAALLGAAALRWGTGAYRLFERAIAGMHGAQSGS
jgi:hypothetical protein